MNQVKTSRIFNKIAERGSESVSSLLGKVGDRLVFMFENFGNHPETDSFFFEDCDLFLCDLIDLADHAERSGMNFLAGHLPRIAELQVSEKFKNSAMPSKNGYRARFLRRPLRDAARLSRKVQQVCSRSFVDSTLLIWEDIPYHFSTFIKDCPAPKHQPSESECFKKMGCLHLSCAASNFDSRFNDPSCVFGYKKLGIMDACRILAKFNGCHISKSGIFFDDGSRYMPIVVPVHLLGETLPSIKKCLDDADHCSSIFFDSPFDNYAAVIPFSNLIANPIDYNPSMLPKSPKGCILGERDGEFYFVCEWWSFN